MYWFSVMVRVLRESECEYVRVRVHASAPSTSSCRSDFTVPAVCAIARAIVCARFVLCQDLLLIFLACVPNA